MKNKELRIGNYIYYTTDKSNIKITAKMILYFSDIYYKPIFLTEDWLKKFGFKFHNWYRMSNYTGGTYLLPYNRRFEIFWEKKHGFYHEFYTTGACKRNNIKYVHQLQNLYFALTGKELKL